MISAVQSDLIKINCHNWFIANVHTCSFSSCVVCCNNDNDNDECKCVICELNDAILSGSPLSVYSIDVHFDDATSGFFIKENSEEIVGREVSEPGASLEDKLSSNLTVLRSSELISLRASYGPFLSRDTVGAAGTRGRLPPKFQSSKFLSSKM